MENMKPMPRVLIAGANSGCGKTSITCGILKALVNRELHIQSYKCGPDYIDPMFHREVLGVPSRKELSESGPIFFYRRGLKVSCRKG